MRDTYPLNINGEMINSEIRVKLIGINIYIKLNFEEHISSLCKQASNHLNAICGIRRYMGFKENEILTVLYIQTLITVLLYGTSAQ